MYACVLTPCLDYIPSGRILTWFIYCLCVHAETHFNFVLSYLERFSSRISNFMFSALELKIIFTLPSSSRFLRLLCKLMIHLKKIFFIEISFCAVNAYGLLTSTVGLSFFKECS